jgi:hypothetical protein
VSISAAEKDHDKLAIGPASSYPYKQSSEGLTIAADVYETGDKVKAAFGKHNPYDYGVLPVLVVIDNHTGKTLRLDHMTVEYDMPGHGKIESTPAEDVKFIGVKQPRSTPLPQLPIPGVGGLGHVKKGPLNDWEIEGRAFAAKMIPPNESASGFFYFQTGHRSNSSLYLTGIDEAETGRELLYFEIPLAPVQ